MPWLVGKIFFWTISQVISGLGSVARLTPDVLSISNLCGLEEIHSALQISNPLAWHTKCPKNCGFIFGKIFFLNISLSDYTPWPAFENTKFPKIWNFEKILFVKIFFWNISLSDFTPWPAFENTKFPKILNLEKKCGKIFFWNISLSDFTPWVAFQNTKFPQISKFWIGVQKRYHFW